jgi:hypothetical protein
VALTADADERARHEAAAFTNGGWRVPLSTDAERLADRRRAEDQRDDEADHLHDAAGECHGFARVAELFLECRFDSLILAFVLSLWSWWKS